MEEADTLNTKSLSELKEMLIEKYDYIFLMYNVSQSQNSKRYFITEMESLEKRINEIDGWIKTEKSIKEYLYEKI